MSDAPAVDLVVTCFERTYRVVLGGGHIARIEADNRRRFESRTVLINNVDDLAHARELAAARIAEGEITRAVVVAEHLDAALARTGLDREDLEPMPYFLDWALVAACLDGPDHMLHWDADVRLLEPVDWVGPALALMGRDPRVIAANPNWEVDNLDSFALEQDGPFVLGHGFSDQVYLARRGDLARPIYRQRCIARRRYPFPWIYEARIDAHQRHHGRLRATHRDAIYVHPVAMGTSWPSLSRWTRITLALGHLAIAALRLLPWRPRHIRGL